MAARLYSLYKRYGNRWVRASELAYPVEQARKVFQGRLLQGCFGGETYRLKPIPKAELLRHAAEVNANYGLTHNA